MALLVGRWRGDCEQTESKIQQWGQLAWPACQNKVGTDWHIFNYISLLLILFAFLKIREQFDLMYKVDSSWLLNILIQGCHKTNSLKLERCLDFLIKTLSRLYFTSESHIHSLLTVLTHGGLIKDKDDEQWTRSFIKCSQKSPTEIWCLIAYGGSMWNWLIWL